MVLYLISPFEGSIFSAVQEKRRKEEAMKISTKGRYGLRILIDLATHDPEKPRMLKDIAQKRPGSSTTKNNSMIRSRHCQQSILS